MQKSVWKDCKSQETMKLSTVTECLIEIATQTRPEKMAVSMIVWKKKYFPGSNPRERIIDN